MKHTINPIAIRLKHPYAVMVYAKYPKHPVPTSTTMWTCLHIVMAKALKVRNVILGVKGLIHFTCSQSGNKMSRGNNLRTLSIREEATGKLLHCSDFFFLLLQLQTQLLLIELCLLNILPLFVSKWLLNAVDNGRLRRLGLLK